jgi:hypothetical protein
VKRQAAVRDPEAHDFKEFGEGETRSLRPRQFDPFKWLIATRQGLSPVISKSISGLGSVVCFGSPPVDGHIVVSPDSVKRFFYA